jgi:membrane protease YdiL (CAAX protease family)
MKQNTISNQIAVAWSRLPLILRAILAGLTVSSVGIALWSIMLSGIAAPWSILPMIIALWAYFKFFSGSWGSKKDKEATQNNFRSINLSPWVWKWGISAAILFVIIVQASFVMTFRIIDFPSVKFTADYKLLDSMPIWVAWSVLVMGSIVAGICEETGFRGYMQAPLEKKYGPSAGIIITSIIFMLIHLSHSWASPILPHIFFASVLLGILACKTGSLIPGIIGHSILDIFDYSVWWSDITGGFHKLTIFRTGLDIHFIVWGVIFIFAIFAFFWAMGRIKKGDRA